MPRLPYTLEHAIKRGHLRYLLADLRWRWMQRHDPDLERRIAQAEAMLAELRTGGFMSVRGADERAAN